MRGTAEALRLLFAGVDGEAVIENFFLKPTEISAEVEKSAYRSSTGVVHSRMLVLKCHI